MLRCILLGEAPWLCESYNLLFWLRTSRYTGADTWLRYTVYPFARYMLYRLTRRMGVWIPPSTRIGSGLRLWHCGGIFVNGHAVIGRNCNISQGVTIGQANRGHPVLGDNVYIGPGAKIVGAVRIGHNVAIGANCVVTRDVPDNAVVVGIPGRVISHAGSAGYVANTDYDTLLGVAGCSTAGLSTASA